MYTHYSEESTTCDSELKNQIGIKCNKNSHFNTSLQSFHRKCYLSNALTQIIINDYKVQYSVISILLERLDKDCQECKDILSDACIHYIEALDKYNDKFILPLQILSIIANDDRLNRVRIILSKYPNDLNYYKTALFNEPIPSGDEFIMLLNHFNNKCKTRYQNVFDKLSIDVTGSIWQKTFNSIQKDNYKLFNDISPDEFIQLTDRNPHHNIVNDLYIAIVNSLMDYLNNPCVNYFDIRNLINGLIALILKFDLKSDLKFPFTIYNILSNIICNCNDSKYCISGVLLKSEAVKLSRILNLTPLKVSSENSPESTFYPSDFTKIDNFKELSLEDVICILDSAIKYMESLDDIKSLIEESTCYNIYCNNSQLIERINLLREKYNCLNDRADLYLVLDYDSLFYEDGSLRNWLRSSETCDCPGE